MRALSATDRMRLIDHVAGGHRVGDEDEQTLVRLLATTPAGQAAGVRMRLGAARLQQLDTAIDFDEYRDYHTALRALFFDSLSPEQAAEQMGSARVFPWADPGLIHALWNVRFYYEEVELHDDGKLHVRYWTNVAAFGTRAQAVALDPFEMIAVRFLYPEEHAGAQRDQTIYMPAINLRGLHRKQFRDELQTAADVGLLAAGGVGLVGAGARLARTVAALDLALGAADLVIRDFRPELARSEAGRDFLAAWDIVSTLVAVYGVARVALEVPQATQRLRRAWQRLRRTGAIRSMGDLGEHVDGVLDSAGEVEDLARPSTRGDKAAGQAGDAATSQVGDAKPRQSAQAQPRPKGRYTIDDWTQGTPVASLIRSHARRHQGRFPERSTSGGREVLFRQAQDGNITAYMVYDDAGLPVKRVDVDPASAPHGGIDPPHVLEFVDDVAPNGRSFRQPGATRGAKFEEYADLRNDL